MCLFKKFNIFWIFILLVLHGNLILYSRYDAVSRYGSVSKYGSVLVHVLRCRYGQRMLHRVFGAELAYGSMLRYNSRKAHWYSMYVMQHLVLNKIYDNGKVCWVKIVRMCIWCDIRYWIRDTMLCPMRFQKNNS